MKANKFFAVALAALALVGFNSCKPEVVTETLTLDQNSISLTIGQEANLVANIAVTYSISDASVAELTPAADGKTVAIKGLAKGSAFVTAKAEDGQTKTCAVAVSSGEQKSAEVKGSKIWPVLLDGVTYEANASKVVADFRVNDETRFLYVWDGTYQGNNNPSGKNFYGNNEGYTAMTVTGGSLVWSGCGFFLNESNKTAYDDLCKAIAADAENFYLHLSIKSTDHAVHAMYAFNVASVAKWGIGGEFVDNGTVFPSAGDFTRDGEWHEYDLALAPFAANIAATDMHADDKGNVGANILCFLSGGTAGTMLDLDAIYFYQK